MKWSSEGGVSIKQKQPLLFFLEDFNSGMRMAFIAYGVIPCWLDYSPPLEGRCAFDGEITQWPGHAGMVQTQPSINGDSLKFRHILVPPLLSRVSQGSLCQCHSPQLTVHSADHWWAWHLHWFPRALLSRLWPQKAVPVESWDQGQGGGEVAVFSLPSACQGSVGGWWKR